MKTHNERLVGLAKDLSAGNVKKSWEAAELLTRPSKATHFGSVIGLTIGTGLVCGGLIVSAMGKGLLGVGGLTAGVITVASNIRNLKKC